jgi:hypothetical protein
MTAFEKKVISYQLAHGAVFAQILRVLTERGVISAGESSQLLKDAAQTFVHPQATEMEAAAIGVIASISERL